MGPKANFLGDDHDRCSRMGRPDTGRQSNADSIQSAFARTKIITQLGCPHFPISVPISCPFPVPISSPIQFKLFPFPPYFLPPFPPISFAGTETGEPEEKLDVSPFPPFPKTADQRMGLPHNASKPSPHEPNEEHF
jgi:hypothetical protein